MPLISKFYILRFLPEPKTESAILKEPRRELDLETVRPTTLPLRLSSMGLIVNGIITPNHNFIFSVMQQHAYTRKKRSNDQLPGRKSPYFASVRRKSKMTPNQALSITKYPAISDNDRDNVKKKSIDDDLYGRGSKQKIKQTFKSTPKEIVISSKTLDIVEKYSSYKSIHLSSPKIKESSRKFRTKTRSGNSLSNQNSLHIRKQTVKEEQEGDRQDWLCRELIANEVYGTYDDDELL